MNSTFHLTDPDTPATSGTAVSGVFSDDGYLTLAQSLGDMESDVVVLSPAMLAELSYRLQCAPRGVLQAVEQPTLSLVA